MISRIFGVAVTALLLAAPGPLEAQVNTANITLLIPLNLTDLSSDVAWVRVYCSINQGSASDFREIKVSGGQVVTTVNITVTLKGPNLGIGATVYYDCSLKGRTSTTAYIDFSDTGQTGFLYLRPTPNSLHGSFVL